MVEVVMVSTIDLLATNVGVQQLYVLTFVIVLTLIIYKLFQRWEYRMDLLRESVFPDRVSSLPVKAVPKYCIKVRQRSHYNTRSRKRLRRSSLVNRTSEQITVPQISLEEELEKKYGRALREMYSDNEIKQGIMYMCKKGTYVDHRKNAFVIAKNIEHIKKLEDWSATFSVNRDAESGFPEELTKKALIDKLLLFKSWDRAEIKPIVDKTFKVYGFYPLVTEFCEIYENEKGKLDQLLKTRKTLREENLRLRQENTALKKEHVIQQELKNSIEELQKGIGELQKLNADLKQRLSCKICACQELEILFLQKNAQ